eukprot:757358-Hanusia_phi.AAC.4
MRIQEWLLSDFRARVQHAVAPRLLAPVLLLSLVTLSQVTLKSGVENMLMHYVPEVTEVVAVEEEEDSNDPVVKRQKEFVAEMTGETYKTPAC